MNFQKLQKKFFTFRKRMHKKTTPQQSPSVSATSPWLCWSICKGKDQPFGEFHIFFATLGYFKFPPRVPQRRVRLAVCRPLQFCAKTFILPHLTLPPAQLTARSDNRKVLAAQNRTFIKFCEQPVTEHAITCGNGLRWHSIYSALEHMVPLKIAQGDSADS